MANISKEDSFSALHPEIIESHILNRLDGPTLASAACSSTQLYELCTRDIFWREICNFTWPSIKHPLVQDIIYTFPSCHNSFFSDSFPTLHHSNRHNYPALTNQLVSAIDIKYQNTVIYSKLEVTQDSSLDSHLWIELLQHKGTVVTPITCCENDEEKLLLNLQTNMKLSWIVIDPTTKRAANVSSQTPVSVRCHWVTGDIQLHYATIMADGVDLVNCKIRVTCGVKKRGELVIKEVNLHIAGMDGSCLSQNRTFSILQQALLSGERKKTVPSHQKLLFLKYLEIRRERRGRLASTQTRLDLIYKIIHIMIFVALLFMILGRLLF